MIEVISPSTPEIILRLVLVSGLLIHKIVWEVMKRRESLPAPAKSPSRTFFKSLVKFSKTFFLIFIVIQTLFLNVFPISDDPGGIRLLGLGLYLIGLGLAIAGRLKLGDNWANIEDHQVLPAQQLVNKGVYRYIRHPIYTGDILLLIGLELALNSWLVLMVFVIAGLTIYQAHKEEAILMQRLPGYGDYQKQTKMFIPLVY